MANKDTARITETVLGMYPRSKQDDKFLCSKIWALEGLVLTPEQQAIFYSDRVSSSESITRHRRKLQEQGKYVAPKPVREARKALAEQAVAQVRYEKQIMSPAPADAEEEPMDTVPMFDFDGKSEELPSWW